ncbi:unnamed protein product [Prunus brigantina]
MPARSTVRRDGDEWWCWWRVLGGAPARCSESDGRMIYGVNEMITEMVLRGLDNQGSYDILMNGFSLQSTTTPRKANKVLSLVFIGRICVVEPDRGKWVVKSAFGIVKHGGVTPINPVRGITSLNGAWGREATWRFNHSIFSRVSYGLRLRPIIPRSRGREDSAFPAFLLFSGRQNA